MLCACFIIFLLLGRTLTRVLLEPGAAHADINGDGVVEHVQALSGAHVPYLAGKTGLGSLKEVSPPCVALVTAQIPVST